MAPEALARVTCPIGMRAGIAIHSKEPGAIAVAVAAEMVAARDASRSASDSALQRGTGKVLSVNKRRN